MVENMNTGQYVQGFYIPKLRNLTNVIIKVLGIPVPVSIMPLLIKTSNAIGYTEKQSDGYVIFIDTAILKKDEPTDFVINLFIHELWHVKQLEDGRLASNSTQTVVIWEGMRYLMATLPHENRPWEIEAKSMEPVYLGQIKEPI